MTNTFTLTDEAADTTTLDTKPATSAWQPGQTESLFGLPPVAAAPEKAPAKTKAAKPKRRKKGEPANEDTYDRSYVPLPEPKPAKKLSKGAQKKADRAQLIKEREADASAMRINGVDGDVEIPKKPWLTIFNGKRARPDEVAETLTDLASMLENGDSEYRSVNALAVQYSNYDIGEAYQRVVMLLDRGVTLGNAMADQEDAFPPVVRELIGAAKQPKDMHRNLRQAAIIIVEADNIKSQVKSALFKPGFMLVFLMIFVIAAVQFLLPMTASMFTGIGAEPPTTTKIIMAIGAWLKWVLLAAIAVAMVASLLWKIFLKDNERIATRVDTASLQAPLVGDIMRMSVAARFCDVLAACLDVGMSELEALETAARACGNRALRAWAYEHVGRQRVGVVAFGDVSKTELLPWNFRNRIETTTSLVRRIEILNELATTFHSKSQERLNRFAERVGPITEGVVVVTVVVVVLLIVSPILTFIPTLLTTIG
jgi:type II secretory pathway component PulF